MQLKSLLETQWSITILERLEGEAVTKYTMHAEKFAMICGQPLIREAHSNS
jgi:hypothetical protein